MFPQKFKMELLYQKDPAIPLLGVYPKKPKTLLGKNVCTPMFIEYLHSDQALVLLLRCNDNQCYVLKYPFSLPFVFILPSATSATKLKMPEDTGITKV